MPQVNITNSQREKMRHALGLPNDRMRSYRNRYSANAQGQAAGEWDDLVEQELALKAEASSMRLNHYRLTTAGAHAALEPGESLDPEDF